MIRTSMGKWLARVKRYTDVRGSNPLNGKELPMHYIGKIQTILREIKVAFIRTEFTVLNRRTNLKEATAKSFS